MIDKTRKTAPNRPGKLPAKPGKLPPHKASTAPRAPKSKRGTLPEFTPVPRGYDRHDGWTPERQHGFIEALADMGSVKSAARAVGMTPEGAYLLRRHPQGEGFRAAWEAALKLGVARLEDVAMDRALNGVEVPVYHFGAVVGTRLVHNDRLLMFILRNRSRKRFAADSLANAGAVEASQLERLKRQWREEWEAELIAEQARTHEEICASIDAKLDRMRAAQLAQRRALRDESGVTIDADEDELSTDEDDDHDEA